MSISLLRGVAAAAARRVCVAHGPVARAVLWAGTRGWCSPGLSMGVEYMAALERDGGGLVTLGMGPERGRGLFATKDLPAGTVIQQRAEPLVSSPHGSALGSHCEHCVAPLDAHQVRVASGEVYCSDACAEHAYRPTGGMSVLRDRCIAQDANFPLMATKLMQRIGRDVQGSASPHTDILKSPTLAHIRELCHPLIERVPDEWARDWELADAALGHAPWFDVQFWARIMGVLHVNAIAVDINGKGPVGTVLFSLASYFNHSCVPNTGIFFGASHHATVRTVRDVARGDELTIAYTDPSQPRTRRRDYLSWAYGFECNCPLCQKQDKKKTTRPK